MYHIVDAETGEMIKKRLFIIDPQAKTEVSDREEDIKAKTDTNEPNKGFKLNVLANLCSAVLDSNISEPQDIQQIQKLELSHQSHPTQRNHSIIDEPQNLNMFYPYTSNGYQNSKKTPTLFHSLSFILFISIHPSIQSIHIKSLCVLIFLPDYGFPYVMSSNQALLMTPPRSLTGGLSSRNSPKDSHLFVMSDMVYHFTQFPQAPFFAPTVEEGFEGTSIHDLIYAS